MTFTVYGPDYSTYVRTVRLTFAEKAAAYEVVPVDQFGGKHREAGHLARNPFGVVPAFDHDGFGLYETDAIIRYVDDVAPGPKLTPSDAKARARMNQCIGIVDSYGYGSLILKVVWQRIVVPMMGGVPDEAIVRDALPRTRLCLAEWERIMGDGPWIAGPEISLADLMLAPVMAYFVATPEAAECMGERPGLSRWWQAMSARPSMQSTAPRLG